MRGRAARTIAASLPYIGCGIQKKPANTTRKDSRLSFVFIIFFGISARARAFFLAAAAAAVVVAASVSSVSVFERTFLFALSRPIVWLARRRLYYSVRVCVVCVHFGYVRCDDSMLCKFCLLDKSPIQCFHASLDEYKHTHTHSTHSNWLSHEHTCSGI